MNTRLLKMLYVAMEYGFKNLLNLDYKYKYQVLHHCLLFRPSHAT